MRNQLSKVIITVAAWSIVLSDETVLVSSFQLSTRGNTPSRTRCLVLTAVSPKENLKQLEEDDNFRSSRRSSSSGREEGPPESVLKVTLRRLAQWSLEDYAWRMSIFQTNQAERMLEESMARMRGQEPVYVRPMDAAESKMGPLGRWERAAVEWLRRVFDEEERRATQILHADGEMIRPKDVPGGDQELGPLGYLEKQGVEFLNKIRMSEEERVKTKTWRPKDLEASRRGPLGDLEYFIVSLWNQIREAELVRQQLIRARGGDWVRPIDIPGPLGEWEMAVAEIFQAESRRARERKINNGRVVRPMDAKYRGPLGEAEWQAYETLQQLSFEEQERLRSISKILQENRPMDHDKNSFLGMAETVLVGIFRAPQMLLSVFQRVQDLLSSQHLDETDLQVLRKRQRVLPAQPSSPSNDPNRDDHHLR